MRRADKLILLVVALATVMVVPDIDGEARLRGPGEPAARETPRA